LNLAFQRFVDRYVGAPLCRLASLLPSAKADLPQQPKAILVILLSEMGSLVLAQPMFQALRARYPQAALHALVFEKNREMLDLLEVIEPQRVLTISDVSARAFARDAWRAIRRMRALPLDAVIDCELFARISSLLAFFSGAALKAGFHPHTQEGLYRGRFINRPVLYNPYLHISQQYLNLASALEASGAPLVKQTVEADLPAPAHKRFAAAEIERYFARLLVDFPALRARPLVLVYPGGGILPIRAWPHDHYLALCRGLLEDGCAIGIIGLKNDRLQAKRLVEQCASRHCLDMTGYTKSIRELLLLFQNTALLVTNDGGPGQFAAITPVPSIVLFGPETPLLYRSLSVNAHFFFRQMSCSPCLSAYNHRNSPCDGDNRCLRHIMPDSVLQTAREILAHTAAPKE
jgi:ADP-heptose:LPS heptosyltransferase